MRLAILFITFILSCLSLRCYSQVLSEGDVIETLIRSLQTKDSRIYIDLFPQTDTIADWVLQYADKTSDAYKRMLYIKENYAAKQDFDADIKKEAEKATADNAATINNRKSSTRPGKQ